MMRCWNGLWLALLLCGCPSPGPGTDSTPRPKPVPPDSALVAELKGRGGVSGQVTFTRKEGKVLVRLTVKGATPGAHGVHIHEKGDCSDAEFKNAGGHFNPAGAPHAGPGTTPRHPGDFGNVTVGPDGQGVLELESDSVTLDEGTTSILGRAVIVHEREDDLTTQPTGNAGGRIACAVIGK